MTTRAQPRGAVVATALFAGGVAAFTLFASRTGVSRVEWVAASAVFALLFMPCLALSVAPWADTLRTWIAPAPRLRSAALWLMLVALWAGYAALARRPDPVPLLMLALYGWVPIALVAGSSRAGGPFRSLARMGLAIAALWLPVEVGLLHGPSLPSGAHGALNA